MLKTCAHARPKSGPEQCHSESSRHAWSRCRWYSSKPRLGASLTVADRLERLVGDDVRCSRDEQRTSCLLLRFEVRVELAAVLCLHRDPITCARSLWRLPVLNELMRRRVVPQRGSARGCGRM